MDQFCRLIVLTGLLALSSILSAQELNDSKGKDFWIAFAMNYESTAIPGLFISSEILHLPIQMVLQSFAIPD